MPQNVTCFSTLLYYTHASSKQHIIIINHSAAPSLRKLSSDMIQHDRRVACQLGGVSYRMLVPRTVPCALCFAWRARCNASNYPCMKHAAYFMPHFIPLTDMVDELMDGLSSAQPCIQCTSPDKVAC